MVPKEFHLIKDISKYTDNTLEKSINRKRLNFSLEGYEKSTRRFDV